MKTKILFTVLIIAASTTAAAALFRCAPTSVSHSVQSSESISINSEFVSHPTADTTFLRVWKACTVLTDAQVNAVDISRLFTASQIDENTKARMMGKSYRVDCRVPLSELRLLRIAHRNAQGQTQLGEMVCNKLIAQKMLRIFRQLYEANYKIERIRLIDEYDADDLRSMADNNSSCFCYREVAGTTTLSKHSLGLAVDINTLYNPYVFTRQGRKHVQPIEGVRYAFNRESRNDIPYKIDHNDLACRLFKAEGFTWGGDWRTVKDYQHFEYNVK